MFCKLLLLLNERDLSRLSWGTRDNDIGCWYCCCNSSEVPLPMFIKLVVLLFCVAKRYSRETIRFRYYLHPQTIFHILEVNNQLGMKMQYRNQKILYGYLVCHYRSIVKAFEFTRVPSGKNGLRHISTQTYNYLFENICTAIYQHPKHLLNCG